MTTYKTRYRLETETESTECGSHGFEDPKDALDRAVEESKEYDVFVSVMNVETGGRVAYVHKGVANMRWEGYYVPVSV